MEIQSNPGISSQLKHLELLKEQTAELKKKLSMLYKHSKGNEKK